MANINAFTGVGVAGMSRTLHVAEAAAAAAHPAFGRTPPRVPQLPFRRSASAAPPPRLVASVDRGTI